MHSEGKQVIKAIILAGNHDFGTCKLASHLPTALWPVLDKPALERLLRHLSRQGITQAAICSNGDASLLKKSIPNINSIELEFLDEPLPVGTAGCIRDVANRDPNALFLIFRAGMTSPPDINVLTKAHRIGKSDLTVVFESDQNSRELPYVHR